MGARRGAQSARLLVNADIDRSPSRAADQAGAREGTPERVPAGRKQGGAASHPFEPPLRSLLVPVARPARAPRTLP